MAGNKTKVIVEVETGKEVTIKPLGAKLAETSVKHPDGAEVAATATATGTGTNPPDSDGDGDIDF